MYQGYSVPVLLRRAGALIVGVGLLLGLVRCDWATEPVEEQSLVVEAFLETGRPLPAVTLRKTRPLSSAEGVDDAASGAEVTLVLGDSAVSYTETAPGRYAPTETPVVPARTPWRLTVEWNGSTARAEGVSPPPIDAEEVCVDVPAEPARAIQVDSLRRDSLDIPADQGYLYPVDVTVRWAGVSPTVAGAPYWVRAQLRPDATPFRSGVVEFFLEPAEIQREDQFTERDGARQWKGVYAVPVDSSDAPLPTHDLTTAVVRGDTAFASFAQTRTDPDRREPVSNVDGALGIATAVSVDSLVSDSLAEGLTRCWAPSP